MPFPDYPRVIYARNPLVEVVCQVDFPPILRISAEEPMAFQERIRHLYPNFDTSQGPESLPDSVPDVLRPFLQGAFQDPTLSQGLRQFQFSDAAHDWHVFLSRDTLSLATDAYTRWEDFNARFTVLLDTLLEEYSPSYFTRVELTYKNLVSPQRAGNKSYTWTDLLSSPVLGELATPALEGFGIVGARREIRLELESDLFLTLSHGFVVDDEQGDPSYLIDAEYHKEGQIATHDCLANISRCHSYAGKIFRWCITDTLHDALGPTPVED